MVWTSCKTDLGQRWWGSICPLPGVAAFSGNMFVAMCMPSPRIFCRSVGREIMDSLSPNIGPVGSAALDRLGESLRLVSMA